ncbi:phosphoesterase PA-phosphatase, partial [Streptomyces rochei]|nr:phosphoesterase PA-phosphatase [Streptomyces rochei]
MTVSGPRPTRRGFVALGAAALLSASVAVPRAVAADRRSAVLTWYDATAEAVAEAGAATQVTNSR